MTTPEPTPKRHKSLTEWQKIYPYDGVYHPWVHYVKAIPMGDDGQAPMNHSLETLNNMAIHLERLGFKAPDSADSEIKYVPPAHGPNVPYNPGAWVDVNVEVPEAAPDLPQIDLTGVPLDQLAVLQKAIQDERIRLAQVEGADGPVRDQIEAATPVANIVPTEGE